MEDLLINLVSRTDMKFASTFLFAAEVLFRHHKQSLGNEYLILNREATPDLMVFRPLGQTVI